MPRALDSVGDHQVPGQAAEQRKRTIMSTKAFGFAGTFSPLAGYARVDIDIPEELDNKTCPETSLSCGQNHTPAIPITTFKQNFKVSLRHLPNRRWHKRSLAVADQLKHIFDDNNSSEHEAPATP